MLTRLKLQINKYIIFYRLPVQWQWQLETSIWGAAEIRHSKEIVIFLKGFCLMSQASRTNARNVPGRTWAWTRRYSRSRFILNNVWNIRKRDKNQLKNDWQFNRLSQYIAYANYVAFNGTEGSHTNGALRQFQNASRN